MTVLFMKRSILLLIVVCLFSLSADAAYVIKHPKPAPQSAQPGQERVTYYHKAGNFLTPPRGRKWQPRGRKWQGFSHTNHQPRRSERGDGSEFGVSALTAGLVGVACMAAALALFSPALVAIGITAAIVAIVCGAIGIRREKPALSIIGMCLGIAGVVVGFLFLAEVLVVAALFSF